MVDPHFIKQTLLDHSNRLFDGIPVLFAYLYGSYALSRPHPFSDLDIAVYVKDNLSTTGKYRMEMNLALEIDQLFPDGPSSDVRSIKRSTIDGRRRGHFGRLANLLYG